MVRETPARSIDRGCPMTRHPNGPITELSPQGQTILQRGVQNTRILGSMFSFRPLPSLVDDRLGFSWCLPDSSGISELVPRFFACTKEVAVVVPAALKRPKSRFDAVECAYSGAHSIPLFSGISPRVFRVSCLGPTACLVLLSLCRRHAALLSEISSFGCCGSCEAGSVQGSSSTGRRSRCACYFWQPSQQNYVCQSPG